MDAALTSLMKELPAVGAIIFTVVWFLRSQRQRDTELMGYLRDRDSAFLATTREVAASFAAGAEKQASAFRELGAECHAVQREGHKVIADNSAALNDLRVTLGRGR